MSEQESTTAVVEATPVATAPAKKAKAAPKKRAVKGAKKATKKAAKGAKAVKKEKGTGGGRMDDTHDTVRLRVFKLLKKTPNGLTGAAIAEKLELKGIPSLLKDEGMNAAPRIKREFIEGTRGAVYSLTAAGKKAVEAGTVNSDAPASASGKEWK